MRLLAILILSASPLSAAIDAGSTAALVRQNDAAIVEKGVRDAIASPDALTRAAGARVATVRNLTVALPLIREAIDRETDAVAAREYLRALIILGTRAQAEEAISLAAKWPASMDDSVADAVARRESAGEAVDIYLKLLRNGRMQSHAAFFQRALWQQTGFLPAVASRLLGARDSAGWGGLLTALADAKSAPPPELVAVAFGSSDEDIRQRVAWFVVHGYALDPEKIPEPVRAAATAIPSERSSDREEFGRELIRRMSGLEARTDPRWLQWLATDEADTALARDNNVLKFLTVDEYAVREQHCGVVREECVVPERSKYRQIPSQAVAARPFDVPSPLPPGLAEAAVASARCKRTWLGVADVTVDRAGRVTADNVKDVETDAACRTALETLLQLSLASNTSLRSPATGPVLVVHAESSPLCLGEAAPSDQPLRGTLRIGGDVRAPVVTKRVEPRFPASTRQNMGGGRNVIVIAESTISHEGCVRDIHIVSQSPFPELNGAAALALSQWRFEPGKLNGEPADVRFYLTINFSTR
jgi:TonB family protein